MKFSLIIPAFNEEGNIGNLVDECFAAIDETMLGELIVVDDGSDDNTLSVLKDRQQAQDRLRIIRHETNAGQSTSLRTGIMAARFDLIAQLDGDGQNDPADLPKMLEHIAMPGKDGPALIGGIRTKRQDTGSKRLASRFANSVRQWILRDDCPDTGCGTKLYWREAYLRLPFFTSIHRYLPALFQANGYRCKYVPVNDRPRQSGTSKYNNLHRGIIGISDMFGVVWLRRRTKKPKSTEV